MIYGIGTDIIEIDRIANAIENTGFCKRFFSEEENLYFLKKHNHPQTIAGNFAAKEAFSKALGTGFRNISLKDISVLRDSLGKPYIKFSENLNLSVDEKKVFVSISHSNSYAVAYVVIEK